VPKLRVGILDLVARAPTTALYPRIMNPNLAGIMPQVIAAWSEELGHEPHVVCYTGFEDLATVLPTDCDVLFVSAFSQSAQLAYAISHMFRQRGTITVLGGPHARCYPEDAARFFDYVLGFTDRAIVDEVLRERAPGRSGGRILAAERHPLELPSLARRWKFLEPTLAKAPLLKMVPVIGSLGCPYTCSFCIDSTVEYQPLGFPQLADDIRFVLTKHRQPILGWHDPNFGVRFDDYMDAIEAADPQHRVRHVVESSLSLLSEPNLVRLRRNGVKAVLPGVESWYDLGNKSKTRRTGMEKVAQVAEHVNLIRRYIPYIQTNFVLGLDCDEGDEPFELTKRFIDLAPGAFPGFSLLSAFGRAAPSNLDYQRDGRVLATPHHFLNNNHAMNVRPRHYDWPGFYDRLIGLTRYAFSGRAIARRIPATSMFVPKWMNVVRAVSSEGWGRITYHTMVRGLLESDREFRGFLDGEHQRIPAFYRERVLRELGPMAAWLPAGAMEHDPNAYLGAQGAATPVPLRPGRGPARSAASAPLA
jgi:hypothetical protein